MSTYFRFFVILTEIDREKKGYMEADLIDIYTGGWILLKQILI
jgi:hypothetical protein